MSKCMTCYLNTGFMHDYRESEEHEHIDGKIVFKHSIKDMAAMGIEESIEESRFKYYGITPFHAEGTTLGRIVDRHLTEVKDMWVRNSDV